MIIYFIGSYKNRMHYTDGIDVYEIEDYRWAFSPTFDTECSDYVDEFLKLTDEQKLRYDNSYENLPKLLNIYKGK